MVSFVREAKPNAAVCQFVTVLNALKSTFYRPRERG